MKRIIKNKKGDMTIDLTNEEWDILQNVLSRSFKLNVNGSHSFVIENLLERPAENYNDYKKYVK